MTALTCALARQAAREDAAAELAKERTAPCELPSTPVSAPTAYLVAQLQISGFYPNLDIETQTRMLRASDTPTLHASPLSSGAVSGYVISNKEIAHDAVAAGRSVA